MLLSYLIITWCMCSFFQKKKLVCVSKLKFFLGYWRFLFFSCEWQLFQYKKLTYFNSKLVVILDSTGSQAYISIYEETADDIVISECVAVLNIKWYLIYIIVALWLRVLSHCYWTKCIILYHCGLHETKNNTS